jgi:uncharacterized protein
MDFDRFTVVLLLTNPAAPELDDEAAAELQDAHMSHLADLHAAGHLLAAGPLSDERRCYRGLSIMSVGPEQARELKEADPAVRAGVFRIEVIPWMVPAGALASAPARFPRSIAEASAQ